NFCHIHLFKTISVQTDKALSTQGDITYPSGKLRPDYLREWTDFLDTQKDIFERLYSIYPRKDLPRVFEPLSFLETYGERVASRKLASEEDLLTVQRETVETPVSSIVGH